MPLDTILRLHRVHRPERTALIDGEKRYDFARLDRCIDGAAHALVAQGIRRGQLVGVALSDHAEHLILMFALARVGAVMLPMDIRWLPEEKLSVAGHFGAGAVIVEADDPAAGLSALRWLRFDPGWCAPVETPYLDPEITDETPLLLSLSSGTTGLPKGPRVTHKQFENRFMVYWINIGMTAHDTYVAATPFYFGGGRGFTLAMLFAGATVSVFPPRHKMPELVEHVRAIGATALFLVPTQIRRALEENLPALAFPSLRVLISSGSALHPEERLAIQRRLTPNLFEFYASTEGGGISVLGPADCARYPASVGRPVFRCAVEVVDGEHRPLPPGHVGRLRYRSPASATSYWRGDSSEAFRDGWFYPGDLAEMNAEGFLFLRGRAKDMIIRGGVNIYPQDVETVVMGLPGVKDVVVAGVPSPGLGEEVAAFVVAERGVDAEAVMTQCRAHLAPYKVPSIVRFLDQIPRNAGGKALKPELVALVTGAVPAGAGAAGA